MSLILKYDLGNPRRLPAGYTPLAYVSMPGNTYINTGLTGNQDTRVYLSYVSRGTGTSGSGVFGGRISAAENTLAIYTAWSGNTFCSWGNTYTGLGGTFDLTKRYNIYINKNSWKVNDSSEHTFSSATFTTPVMFVGGVNSNGSTHASDVDFYKCTIWQNQTLVMDLIPAKRNSDGVIGMFDIVSQTFKTNAGTGVFIAGPEVVVLPYEYLLVEYLESTGVLYIITNFIPDNTSGMYVKASCSTTGGNHVVCGCRETGDARFWVNFSTNLEISWNTWEAAGSYDSKVKEVENNYLNSRLGKINGTTYRTNYPTLANITRPCYLFCGNSADDVTSIFSGKIFNVKFSKNSTITHNFIPCYRRSDLKPGMYDTVNNVFYTNSGSGEFILGPVVEESSRQLEYNNAGSNYIGKPINIHHSTSNPSSTLINLGSGEFDGSSSYINCGTFLSGVSTKNTTCCFWINPDNQTGSKLAVGSLHGSSQRYYIGRVGNKYGYGTAGNGWAGITEAPANIGEWSHLALTIDSSGVPKFYYNGQLVNTRSAVNYNFYGMLQIGCANACESFFDGKIYDFRVYDEALTADEILKIYKGGL